MKILNLYSGIGGNRKLWGDTHDITAVEYDENIAKVYQDYFPNDKVVIGDAHQYLLEHFREFDFIWSSPPCPTHSQFAKLRGTIENKKSGCHKQVKYPEMSLYQEIIVLQHFFEGNWVIENVTPYYEPLMKAQKVQRHLFWSNKVIPDKKFEASNIKRGKVSDWEKQFGYDLSSYKGLDKRKVLRNCVLPELGFYVFNQVNKDVQGGLF